MYKCKSCGRMLKAVEQGGSFCKNCMDENGNLRSYDEVASNLAVYLRETQGLDEKASINAAKAIVSSQPVWEKKQGVYFEGDMKKRNRLVITLIVILGITLGGIGSYVWIYFSRNSSYFLFKRNENYEITRNVGDIKVHELDIPNTQKIEGRLFDDDPHTFVFMSPNKKYAKKRQFPIHYKYDISNSKGQFLATGAKEMALNSKNGMYLGTPDFSRYDDEGIAYEDDGISYFNTYVLAEKHSSKNEKGEKGLRERIYKNASIYYSDLYNFEKYDVNTWVLWINRKMEKPVLLDKHIVWLQEVIDPDSILSKYQLMLFNPFSNQEKVITKTLFDRKHGYGVSEDFIVWMDNRNIKREDPVLYCYDVKKDEEFIIDDQEGSVVLASNSHFVIVSDYIKDEEKQYLKGLKIYDLKKREYLQGNDPAEGFSFQNLEMINSDYPKIHGLYSCSFIDTIMSKDSNRENSYVAWVEQIEDISSLPKNIGIKKELSSSPRMIGVKNLASKGTIPMRVWCDVESKTNQKPLLVTDEYIVWQGENDTGTDEKLFIGKISDGLDDRVIESVLLDKFEDFSRGIGGHYEDVFVTEEVVFWLKSPFTNNSSVSKENICWARLSEIFPDTQVADSEGQNE